MGKIIVGQSTNFLCFSMIDFNYFPKNIDINSFFYTGRVFMIETITKVIKIHEN